MALKRIQSNGHVISPQPSFTPKTFKIDLKKVGHSKASTFPVFCKKHDKEIFSEIEDQFEELSPKALTLLAYRSVSKELFTKLAQIRMHTSDRFRTSMIKTHGESYYDEYIQNAVVAKAELEGAKSQLEEMLHTDSFENFISQLFLFEDNLPCAYSGSFSPEFDLHGTKILPDSKDDWGIIFAFCGNVGGQNLLLLASTGQQNPEQIERWFKSVEEKEFDTLDFAINLGLDYLENIFLSPDWVEGLSPMLQKHILRKAGIGLPFAGPRSPDGLFEIQFQKAQQKTRA
ncbi:hypothetical protein NBRC116597_15470 [Phaeobacter sp. NW0010-22]